MNVCKQTFHISHVGISQKVKYVLMWNLQQMKLKILAKFQICISVTLRVENYNVFNAEVDKIALSANDDKRIQSIDLRETYAYGWSKDILIIKEIKCNNIIK